MLLKLLKTITYLSLLATLYSGAASAQRQSAQPKLVTLAPHIVELIFELGAGAQIVGTTEHSDYPKAALDIPRIGNYNGIQMEKILALKPDYILAWQSSSVRQDLERLEQLGFKVIYSNPKNLADVAKNLALYGELSGHPEQGQLLADKFLSRLAKLKSTYSERKPIKTFYELWSNPLTTIAGNAWPQQQVALCGGTNPFVGAASDYPQISIEQVVSHDPQLIIQPASHGSVSDRVNWQQWPTLTAVKNKAILHPNADLLHRMTSRMLDGVEQLCIDMEVIRQQL